MNAYWQNLNQREQGLIGLAVTCIIIYLSYLFIYAPIHQAIIIRTAQLNERRTTLAWIEKVQQQTQGAQERLVIEETKLLSMIAAQLGKEPFKAFPHQLQQTNQGDIQLSFDKVPYQLFLSWLWELDNHYKIMIKQLFVERLEIVGLVQLTVIITLAN